MMQSGRLGHAKSKPKMENVADHLKGVIEAEVKYTGTMDCFSKTLKEEGMKGLFSGNLSNIYRSIGSSLVLVLYDQFQHWMVDISKSF